MRISDWSSDVCSSDLPGVGAPHAEQLAEHLADFRRGDEIAARRARRAEGIAVHVVAGPGMRQRLTHEVGHRQGAFAFEAGAQVVEEAGHEDRPTKIGRASCWEKVCQYGSIQVVAVSLKTKKKENNIDKK